MTLSALKAIAPDTFTPQDHALARTLAREASRSVARLNGRGAVHVETAAEGQPRQSLVLPAEAIRLLTEILTHLADGRSVSVVPTDAELTTQQAADMLNVSRPHLVTLLNEGRLACHMVGTHRRVKLDALIAYRHERDQRSATARRALAEEAQELDMGY